MPNTRSEGGETITGTMEVTGAVDFDSTLNVDGVATFQTNVIVDQIIKAFDAAGIQLQDDGGNIALVVIDGGVVAVGGLTSVGASVLGVKAGTSTNDAAVGGILYEDHVGAGQVGAGPDTLAQYSIPANTLAVNGQAIYWRAFGTVTTAGGTGTVKIVYGATTILTMPWSAVSNGAWEAEGTIIRTGAATQRSSAKGVCDTGSGNSQHEVSNTTPAETLSGAVLLKVTGESSANINNDTVCHSLRVFIEEANT